MPSESGCPNNWVGPLIVGALNIVVGALGTCVPLVVGWVFSESGCLRLLGRCPSNWMGALRKLVALVSGWVPLESGCLKRLVPHSNWAPQVIEWVPSDSGCPCK